MIGRARTALFSIFIAGLLGIVLCLLVASYRGVIYLDDVTDLLAKVVGIYSVHLAVMLGATFGRVGRPKPPRVDVSAFWIAVGFAGLWNVLLLGRVLVFACIDRDSIPELERYLVTVSSGSSFMVAGALTYFFAKS